MGLFLQMSGVIGASPGPVLAALDGYARGHSIVCEQIGAGESLGTVLSLPESRNRHIRA